MQKKIILLLGLIFFSKTIISAQDTIVNRSGSSLIVKIVNQSSSKIKYKKFDNLNGPLYIIPTAQVEYIKYENGNKKSFSNDIRKTKPVGLSIDIAGSSILFGLSANWFVTPKINIEAGYDFGGFHTVGRYYFLGNKHTDWFPYIGAGYMEAQFIFFVPGPYYRGGYFPVGCHFIEKGGFSFMSELSYIHLKSTTKSLDGAYVGVKIGYQF